MHEHSDRLASLASPAFIAALGLLVVNDFALKPVFHNAVTGKLSDLAGLFALTLFVATLWPRYARLLGATLAAAFSFWKTSYSEPLIEWVNSVSPLAFGRTIDLTDLVALPMIPLGIWAAPRLKPWPLPKLLQLGLASIALVAFTATSRARFAARDTMDVTRASIVDPAALATLFDEIAAERTLRCAVCVPLADGRVYVAEQDSDVQALIVKLDAPQTLSYTVTGYDRQRGVRSLARHIRGEIEDRFPDMVVVDTTSDVIAVRDGATAIFVVRVPRGESTRNAEETLSSLVASAARDHGLELDARSSVYYAPTNPGRRSKYQDFTLGPVSDRNGVLRVRLGRRSERTESLHRAVVDDLATRLGVQFGAENVVMHEVAAAPPEWTF